MQKFGLLYFLEFCICENGRSGDGSTLMIKINLELVLMLEVGILTEDGLDLDLNDWKVVVFYL